VEKLEYAMAEKVELIRRETQVEASV